jgi:Fe-S cluster assembly protein SufD
LSAPGRVVDDPIEIVYVSLPGDVPAVSHPRALIIAGERSEVRLIETFLSADRERHFTNAVAEIVAGPGAVVEHARVGLENARAYHLGGTHVELARDSRYLSHVVALGGELVRHDVVAVLAGEGSHAALNGVTVAGGDALVDHHTELDHAAPHGSSHQVYKHVLADRVRGVFNGRIRVRPGAQKPHAKQTNRPLLLSADAAIHTKPELEIFANDVRCTHGATVGRINEEQWFYLRARGIGWGEARRMLIRAFAAEAVDRIGSAAIRERIEQAIAARLEQLDRGEAVPS